MGAEPWNANATGVAGPSIRDSGVSGRGSCTGTWARDDKPALSAGEDGVFQIESHHGNPGLVCGFQ